MRFDFYNDGTWTYTTKHGRYDIMVMPDGGFDAIYTDNATGLMGTMSSTQVVYTLSQAAEWCMRYEIMLQDKRSTTNA